MHTYMHTHTCTHLQHETEGHTLADKTDTTKIANKTEHNAQYNTYVWSFKLCRSAVDLVYSFYFWLEIDVSSCSLFGVLRFTSTNSASTYTCTHMHTYAPICNRAHVHTHAHICTCMHTYAHTSTHMHSGHVKSWLNPSVTFPRFKCQTLCHSGLLMTR